MGLKKAISLIQWFCLAIVLLSGLWIVGDFFFTDHSKEDAASKALEDKAIAIARERWSPSDSFGKIADLGTVSWLTAGGQCVDGPNGNLTEKMMLAVDVIADDMTMKRRYFYFCVDTRSESLVPSDLAAAKISSMR